jgi:hypothetical protein
VVGVGQAFFHGLVIGREDRLFRAGDGRESDKGTEDRQKPGKNRSSGVHRRHGGGLYVRTSKRSQRARMVGNWQCVQTGRQVVLIAPAAPVSDGRYVDDRPKPALQTRYHSIFSARSAVVNRKTPQSSGF